MKKNKYQKRIIRHSRISVKIKGTKSIPRVSVFKSNRHLFVQFIDDTAGRTILSSIIKPAARSAIKGTKTEKAAAIAGLLAKKAENLGIKKIVFDRGGFKYHGRVKALADGLRKGGLEF